MATRPKSICRHAGCTAAIAMPGYCERHKADEMGWQRTQRGRSSTERGYGAEWRKKRDRVMVRDCGLCQVCKRAGLIRAATEVDHIVSKARAERMQWTPEQMDADENLQAICRDCHKEKTQRESIGQ